MDIPGDTNMLFDILGVLIGFVSVMLLLSLIVTALVQFVQSTCRIRSRNLRRGLQEILKSEHANAKNATDTKAKTDNDFKADAKKLLEPPFKGDFLNPLRTWIESDELKQRLFKYGENISTQQVQAIDVAFKQSYDYLSKRFLLHIRIVGAIIALLVAFIFQVSTLDLLRDLSTDPELRARSVIAAERLLEKADTTLSLRPAYEAVSEEALQLLQEKHPDLAPLIEEAAGQGANRDDIVDELRRILADESTERRAAVVEEYEQLLDDLYRDAATAALERSRYFAGELATFNIKPWAKGWSYYADIRHWIGVLLTMILLQLGAPFWFNMLKTLVVLKDQLKPGDEKENGKNPAKDSTKE